MEAERAHVACVEDGFSVHLDAKGVCRIVNDLEPVDVGNFLDALGVAGRAVHVHRHDGRGVRGNRRFDFFRVDVAGLFVDIDKDGLEAVPPDGMRRRDKTIRCSNHFAGDSHGLEGRDERQRAVREKADILDSEIFSERLFEFLVVVPVVREPFAVPDILEHRDEFVKGREERRGDGNQFIFHDEILLLSLSGSPDIRNVVISLYRSTARFPAQSVLPRIGKCGGR